MTTVLLILALVVAVAFSTVAAADTWAWPAEMSLGGFTVSGIRGGVNADGSGSAAGSLELPGTVGQRVTLNRSARGDIMGTVAISVRMSGSEIQGTFALDAEGLRGRGVTVRLTPRPVIEALATVSTNGRFTGSGRVPLGNVGVPVKFTISRDSLDLAGSTQVQSQADTPLASYSFSGDIRVQAPGGRLAIVAAGTVKRSGKLSNQVSTTQVSDVPVNPNDGSAAVTIDGVNVTFYLFRP